MSGGRNEAASVELHVERLVLSGFDLDARGSGRLRESVVRELSRLFQEGSLLSASSISAPSLQGGDVHWSPSHGVDRLGVAIARSVYRSLGGVEP